MNRDLQDFKAFMQQREAAARAYVNGDASPLGHLVAHHSPVTFFQPRGGYTEGAEEVAAIYTRDATSFASGSSSTFEILHIYASEGIGYWVGFQRATAYLQGQSAPVPFNLQVTEIFRREDNTWKLIHRHADSLASTEGKS